MKPLIGNRYAHTLAGLTCVLSLMAAPGIEAGRRMTIKGSDTMLFLVRRLAESYMQANQGQNIDVTGGDSGGGIAALINGTTDVCMASRPMKEQEKRDLRERFQSMGTETRIARDGLSIYVNEANPVRSITLEQLRRLFLGEITSWKELGGPDTPIALYGRENSSGSYVYFKDNVLKGKVFAARCQELPGTAAVASSVAHDTNGVGYGGAAYAKGVRALGIIPAAGQPVVFPTAATVRDGSYPLAHYLYLDTRGKPAGDVRKFIDYALSPDGQALTAKAGYFPLD